MQLKQFRAALSTVRNRAEQPDAVYLDRATYRELCVNVQLVEPAAVHELLGGTLDGVRLYLVEPAGMAAPEPHFYVSSTSTLAVPA